MRPTRIDQVLTSLAGRDAIGYHTLQLRQLLRGMGFRSDIFFANATPDVKGEGSELSRLGAADPDRWLVYQLSIGSSAGDVVLGRPETVIVNYHNITPADLLSPWMPEVADEVSWGRRQLNQFAKRSHGAIAVSHFNETELLQCGYHRTSMAPPLIDLGAFATRADRHRRARLEALRRQGGTQLLFVGKVAPHKAQHELIAMLALYRRLYDEHAVLHIVGGIMSEDYRKALVTYAGELGLRQAVEITGSVSHQEITAYYQSTDVFVCASRHEGFCVPLVEAMHHGLPVVAMDAGAVAETLSGAGLVGAERDALWMATAVHRVRTDPDLAAAMVERGRRRVEQLRPERAGAAFASALDGLLSDA